MSASPTDLAARLGAGESLDTIMLSMLAADRRAVLMRCAAVRGFDEELYEAVLRGPDGPELAALVADRQVEPRPGEEGVLRVAGLRDAAFTAWWVDEGRPASVTAPAPAALTHFAHRLAAEQDRRGRRRARLDALLLADADAAAELLDELYREADGRDDLAACHDVLDVLEQPDRLPLLTGTALAELYADRCVYLAARTQWSADFLKSAHYFPRPTLERRLDDLLDGGKGRVLQLYARGGMGKTMQLRWLFARHCVPAPRRVPCARVDFDAEDASRAARHPWLLLLRIAEQLEPQLVGEHFQAILDSYGALVGLLYRGPRARPARSVPLLPEDVDGRDIIDRFASVLAEWPADRPALVVLDTCEELLRGAVNPTDLFAMLADLVLRVPALRLLLAGRYDLTGHERLRELGCDLRKLFPGLRSEPVAPFDADEQRRYLSDVRGIGAPSQRVDAILGQANGTPFLLAAFADLVRLDPDITAEDIRRAEGPGLLYCIERILKRVEDDVRWLLLYGVVPRRLSFDFLDSVMRRFLVEGMRAGSPLDDETSSSLLLHPVTPPRTATDLRDLWRRLLAYAAQYSWVWIDADGAVGFHDDVIEPLRAMARRARFYPELHGEALAFYERRADRDGARWDEWTCEAVFHRFQLEGADAAAYWSRKLREARERGRSDWLLAVASEPLRREYLDEDNQPRSFSGDQPIVRWQTVAEAHVHCAWALAEQAAVPRLLVRAPSKTGSRRSVWDDVQTHVETATRIAARGDVRLPEPETTVLWARLALAHGKAPDAKALLERSWTDRPGLRSRDADQVYRLALHEQGREDAWAGFEEVWAATDPRQDPLAAQQAASAIAAACVERGRFAQAVGWLERARELDRTGANVEHTLLPYVTALRACGRPAEALRVAQSASGGLASLARALALVACEQPREALVHADHAAAAAFGDDAYAESSSDVLALRGYVHAELFQFDQARSDLTGAVARARRLRDTESEAGYAALAARVQMRHFGDLRNAAASVDDAEEAEPRPGGEGWLATRLTKAELLARMGRARQARDVLGRIGVPSMVSSAVELAICELLVTPGGDAGTVRRLAALLDDVDPPLAALPLVANLHLVQPLRAVPQPERERLRAVVLAGWDHGGTIASEDEALLALVAAEVHRATGHPDQARRLLDGAVRRDAAAHPFLWHRWLDAMLRCGRARAQDPAPPDDPFQADDLPGLRASWLIRLVEHRAQLEPRSWVRERLDDAAALLDRLPSLPTLWRARLEEAKAALERDSGDARGARRVAATASAAWARLGNEPQRRLVVRDFELGEARPTRDERCIELRLSVRRGADGTPVGVEVAAWPSAGRKPRPRRLELGLFLDAVPPQVSGRLRAASAALTRDWRGWGRAVGGKLVTAEMLERSAGPGGALSLQFVCQDDEVAALPWEFVTLPGPADAPAPYALHPGMVYRCLGTPARHEHKITAAQAALTDLGHFDGGTDGLAGPSTEDAVRSFQRLAGMRDDGVLSPETWRRLRAAMIIKTARRRPRVLVLRAEPADDSGPTRNPTPSAVEVSAVYRSRGAQVVVADLRDLARPGGRGPGPLGGPPDVVHVQASVELVGGAVVLDGGHGAGARPATRVAGAPDQLPVTALGDLLSVLSRGSFGPVVVLETPWRRSRSEAVRALLLRNVFAHSLLELGRTVAVLCTGGGAPHDQHAAYQKLAGGVAAGRDVAEIAADLQRLAPPAGPLDRVVPLLGSALFLQRPPATLFPVVVG